MHFKFCETYFLFYNFTEDVFSIISKVLILNIFMYTANEKVLKRFSSQVGSFETVSLIYPQAYEPF